MKEGIPRYDFKTRIEIICFDLKNFEITYLALKFT